MMLTCSVNGQCIKDPDTGRFACLCMPGFEGDGFECSKIGLPKESDITCVFGVCTCPDQSIFDGTKCIQDVTRRGT